MCVFNCVRNNKLLLQDEHAHLKDMFVTECSHGILTM